MPYKFPNASVINYSRESKFLGENFHYANVKNLTVQGFIRDEFNGSGVKDVFLSMSGIIFSGCESGNVNPFQTYQEVFLNDVSIGSGRVTNISFDEGDNNTVRRTNYNIDIEIFDTGDLDNFTGTYYPDDVLTGDLSYLQDLTESFSFDKANDGAYSFSHNVSITFLDNYTGNAITKARTIVSGLFNNEPSFGLLDNEYSGYYFKLKNSGEKNFSESYDLVNLSFDFTKSYNLLSPNVYQNNGAKYNLSTNHDIRISEDGKVTITEQGNIKALNGSVGNAITGALYEIENSAYTRCNDIYTGYKDSNSKFLFSLTEPYTSQELGLANIQLNKNFEVDINSKTANYSVSFSNDINYDVSGSRSANYSVSQQEDGTIQITENGEYNFNFATGLTSDAIRLAKEKYNYITGSSVSHGDSIGTHFILEKPITSMTPTITSKGIQIANRDNLSFSYNTSKSYSKKYAYGPTVSANFKALNVSHTDAIGQKINSTYQIENATTSEILQQLNTFDVSSRQVSINVVLKRKPQYFIYENLENDYLTTSNLTLLHNQVRQEVLNFALLHTDLICFDVFLTNVEYSIDSELNLNYSAQANIVTLN